MAKEKKLVEAITSMEEDFAQWYTDVVKKAELVDSVSYTHLCWTVHLRICMIFA